MGKCMLYSAVMCYAMLWVAIAMLIATAMYVLQQDMVYIYNVQHRLGIYKWIAGYVGRQNLDKLYINRTHGVHVHEHDTTSTAT